MSLRDHTTDEKLTARIEKSIVEGHISHAYLIEGDTYVDKVIFAKDMLKAILCKEAPGVGCDHCVICRKIDHDNYEDLYQIASDGNSVKDEAVFQIQEKLKLKPTAGDRNLVIIQDADTMTVRAQNRLLKTLEEPPVGTVILLLSENRENLLETIRSRCVAYHLRGPQTDWQQAEMEGASEIAQGVLDGETFFSMKRRLAKYVKSKDDALHLLDGLERLYRDFLVGKDLRGRLRRPEEVFRDISLMEEARRDLTAGVNYMYAMKNLIIKMGGWQ